MMNFRRALAALLSFAVAVPANAASLYSGLTRAQTGIQTPTTAAPQLPSLAAPLLGAATLTPLAGIPQTGIPALPASAASAAAVPAVSASVRPAAASAQPAAAVQAAAPASAQPASALGSLTKAADAVSAQPNASAASLNAAFDRVGGNGAAGGSGAQAPDGVESFVEQASRLFHPALNGAAPAVAALTKPQASAQGAIPGDGDLQARMELSPLTNPEREAAVIKLFQAGGAAAKVVDVARGQAPDLSLDGVIQRQDAGRGRHNYIVVKKGKSDRIVVVGGHHDKVSEGAGTIDNWTGATMVTNLHQAMHSEDSDATFVFVAFAREEEGLLGSEAFVRSLTPQQMGRIDSMVNLDTLGVNGTFSWKNNSSRSLLDMIKRVAAVEKRDLVEAYLDGGDADSSTFLHAGIEAMTIFGASQEVIFDIIHTAADTIAAFSLPHYRNAYLLTLALLKTLDKNPVKPAGVN